MYRTCFTYFTHLENETYEVANTKIELLQYVENHPIIIYQKNIYENVYILVIFVRLRSIPRYILACFSAIIPY